MRYAISVNCDRSFTGTREQVKSVLTGAIMASGSADARKAWLRAEAEMAAMDEQDTRTVEAVEVGSSIAAQIWRERGNKPKDRKYLVRVGSRAIPWQTDDTLLLVTYIAALMTADGHGVDKADGLGKTMAYCLSEGGGYPGREVTELKDGRTVYAWFEDPR